MLSPSHHTRSASRDVRQGSCGCGLSAVRRGHHEPRHSRPQPRELVRRRGRPIVCGDLGRARRVCALAGPRAQTRSVSVSVSVSVRVSVRVSVPVSVSVAVRARAERTAVPRAALRARNRAVLSPSHHTRSACRDVRQGSCGCGLSAVRRGHHCRSPGSWVHDSANSPASWGHLSPGSWGHPQGGAPGIRQGHGASARQGHGAGLTSG